MNALVYVNIDQGIHKGNLFSITIVLLYCNNSKKIRKNALKIFIARHPRHSILRCMKMRIQVRCFPPKFEFLNWFSLRIFPQIFFHALQLARQNIIAFRYEKLSICLSLHPDYTHGLQILIEIKCNHFNSIFLTESQCRHSNA